MRLLPLATLLIALAVAAPAAALPVRGVDLVPIGRGAPQGETGAEIAAFDPISGRAFVTNAAANALDVYDLSNPAAPAIVRRVDLSAFGGGPNSVDVSERSFFHAPIVAVAVQATEKTDRGSVQFFDTAGDRLGSAPAGALPDMLTFTNFGNTLLVANEGEPNDAYDVDPEGSVTVIDLPLGVRYARVRTASFDGVPLAGPVRIFGPGATVAQDLEPEYIATDPFGRTAYVTLQENNAVATLDVRSARFTLVRGLGFKDHSRAGNGLDASDRDGAIDIRPRANVFGMYQPDAIAAYSVLGRLRLVTANEGDARAYDGFGEESRVKDLALDAAAFPAGTKADAALGRLNVTTTLGNTDADPAYEQLYAFGGRSMSILDAAGSIVYDTGDELERFTAQANPLGFNADHSAALKFDDRSDNKGPEPEGVDTGTVNGRPYAFLSNERQGGILAYDLLARIGEARIAGYVNTRPDDLGPEGLHFVAARESPTGRPLLLSTNEISGTLSVLEVR